MSIPQFSTQYIMQVVITILCFFPALVFHEVAHGFAAYKLGDPTAKRAGRLTLNPLAHIDIFGTVILPIVLSICNLPVIGYAKPVPYNPSYFKDPRKGDLLVGLAGPCANLIQALVACAIAWLIARFAPNFIINNIVGYYVFLFLFEFTLVNLFLMFFNLLPVPPLDGSSIFAVLIPIKWLPKYYQIERYAMPIFMIVLLAVPYFLHFNPIAIYLDATAGNIVKLIFPITI